MNNIFILLLFLFSSANLFAQCSAYPNIDFEQGNFSGWIGCTGEHPNFNPPTSQPCVTTGIPPNQFSIHQSPDSALCLPPTYIFMPGSGNYSAQLGQDQTAGAVTEQLTYTFVVTSSDTLITYMYALAGVSSGHASNQDVYFEAIILDSTSDTVLGSYTYIIEAQTPFCNWTPVTVNLSPYIGQQITLRFTNADCGQGGHYFVSYVDVVCGQLVTAVSKENILNDIVIYPNPSNGKISLNSSEINSHFIIINILGEKIFETKTIAEQTEINLGNQKSGIYFYQIISENRYISTGKLIIE